MRIEREEKIMAIVPYSSWNAIDRYFDTPLGSWFDRISPREAVKSWVPALDIVETADSYVLTLDVPGVANDEIEITLNDDILTIKGARKLERKDESGNGDTRYRRFERVSGSFERMLKLPVHATHKDISANAKDGILTVNVRKPEANQPKRIAVNA